MSRPFSFIRSVDPRSVVEQFVLDGVIGLARRAQHAVGNPPQMVAVGLELPGQPFFFFHRSHSPVALRHAHDGREAADVTKEMNMQSRRKPKLLLALATIFICLVRAHAQQEVNPDNFDQAQATIEQVLAPDRPMAAWMRRALGIPPATSKVQHP